jgi:hypothetical protein
MLALGPALDAISEEARRGVITAEGARLLKVARNKANDGYGSRNYVDGMAVILQRAGLLPEGLTIYQSPVGGDGRDCSCPSCPGPDCVGDCDPCDNLDCEQCHEACDQAQSCCGYCSDCGTHHEDTDQNDVIMVRIGGYRRPICTDCEHCCDE